MNGFTRTPRRIGARSLLWLGPIFLSMGFVGSNRAVAAAIHQSQEDTVIEPGLGRSWSEYLMGGQSVWSTTAHPPLTQGIEAAMWKSIRNDPLPDTTPVVNFFLWKQSVDPSRFDSYHPRIAQALANIEAQSLAPATTTTTAPQQAQQITPPATVTEPATVPEPSTFFLTTAMIGYALWWRRRQVVVDAGPGSA